MQCTNIYSGAFMISMLEPKNQNNFNLFPEFFQVFYLDMARKKNQCKIWRYYINNILDVFLGIKIS